MPIVQITLSPSVVERVRSAGSGLTDRLRDDLMRHLQPAPQTIQIMMQAALFPAIGCETLCLIHHRASDSRGPSIRAACAKAIHDTLRSATGQSVRIRLIAVTPDNIAAFDTVEVAG